MKLKMYQVDAFSNRVFKGNPAAVCPLEQWLDDNLMRRIAAENNLSETAFYVKESDTFRIRWFTPTTEVDLCGHATLATAYVLYNFEGYLGDELKFESRSGSLKVRREEDRYVLNFPADRLKKVDISSELWAPFSLKPKAIYKGKTDYLLVFENEEEIVNMEPDFLQLAKIPGRGFVVTAKGDSCDFVSRFFAPKVGVNEDPVTGSAHTLLTPYWADRLGKEEMHARQLSARSGELKCKLLNERVEISGQARHFLVGEIEF